MRIFLVMLGLLVLTLVLLFASFTEVEPDGITASERIQCERIIDLTRKEMELLGEKLKTLEQVIETTKDTADDAQRQQWGAELSDIRTRLDRSMSSVTKLEQALESDSPSEMKSAIKRLKSD